MLVYQRVTPDFLKPPVDVFICFFIYSISGWWFQHVSTPLKNMKVSWDYEIPNRWKNKIDVPNHQPDIVMCF